VDCAESEFAESSGTTTASSSLSFTKEGSSATDCVADLTDGMEKVLVI